MRFRPFTSPSPQATGLSSAYISNHIHNVTSVVDDDVVPLMDSDPEMNRLLPRRQRRHHVRIQGRLATVRAVSVASLRQEKNGSPITFMDMSHEVMQQDAYDGDEFEDDIVEHDAQFRAYGIGGAGNIRRPTDVTSSASPSLLSLIHISPSPPTISLDTIRPERSRWGMAGGVLRGLRNCIRKDKTSAAN
ncbi:hypothetical protein EV127DRAFT_480959 [Xylaria flabelliformis]|nr:hypothetical protein EV127DRAFT_480959 [Xylaria flabelliformis]